MHTSGLSPGYEGTPPNVFCLRRWNIVQSNSENTLQTLSSLSDEITSLQALVFEPHWLVEPRFLAHPCMSGLVFYATVKGTLPLRRVFRRWCLYDNAFLNIGIPMSILSVSALSDPPSHACVFFPPSGLIRSLCFLFAWFRDLVWIVREGILPLRPLLPVAFAWWNCLLLYSHSDLVYEIWRLATLENWSAQLPIAFVVEELSWCRGSARLLHSSL